MKTRLGIALCQPLRQRRAAAERPARQNQRRIGIAHVPRGAQREPAAIGFCDRIARIDRTIFVETATWDPAATRKVRSECGIERREIDARLTARDDAREFQAAVRAPASSRPAFTSATRM